MVSNLFQHFNALYFTVTVNNSPRDYYSTIGTALNSHTVFPRRKDNGNISEDFLIIKFTSADKTKIHYKLYVST